MPFIEIRGVDRLVRRLGWLDSLAVLEPPMKRALNQLQRALAAYPPQTRRRMRFVSDRQRRWFFAALNSGQISIPYSRTGNLGRSWTTEIRTSPMELIGEVGNNVPYGPYVQGENTQASIHQGIWQTDQDVFDDLRDQIVADFERSIGAALDRGD